MSSMKTRSDVNTGVGGAGRGGGGVVVDLDLRYDSDRARHVCARLVLNQVIY